MTPLSHHLLTVILLTPLAGAVVILLVSGRRTSAIRWVANAFAAASFLLALPLWFRYEPHGKTWQFAERGEWLPAIGASYYVGADGFSILLILLTTLVAWIAILASWREITGQVKGFYVFMLVMEAGIAGAFMALDFLLFFLFLALAVGAVCGVAMWGRRGRKLPIKFAAFAFAGPLAAFSGVLALYIYNYSVTGAYSFDLTQYQVLTLPGTLQKWVFVAFLAGFGLMVPMFPLHAWLPDTEADAPTAGSVMIGAALLKIGTYGLIRFALPILPDASRFFAPVVATLAIAGVIYGVLAAFAHREDWKRFIAYWTISQTGIVTLAIFTLTPDGLTGSIVQQITVGIATAALFFVAALVHERLAAPDIAPYGGLWKVTPLLATVFLLVAVSAIGVPALSGFVGQFLIVKGAYAAGRLWVAAAAAGIALGAACIVWLYWRTMVAGTRDRGSVVLRDLNPRELAIFVPLVTLSLWIGVHPGPVLRRLETSVGRVVARANPVYAPYVAQGSDCATPAKPDSAGPPPVFVLAEPCADGSDASGKPPEKPRGPER